MMQNVPGDAESDEMNIVNAEELENANNNQEEHAMDIERDEDRCIIIRPEQESFSVSIFPQNHYECYSEEGAIKKKYRCLICWR